MNAKLEVISLGSAFNGAFSDRTLALTFAMKSLNSITIDIPVTGQTVKTLKTQCNGTLPLLNNLQSLSVKLVVAPGETVVHLLHLMPNLSALHITIECTYMDQVWQPGSKVFEAIGKLINLRTLFIEVTCYSSTSPINPQPRYTSIDVADLVALAGLEQLRSLTIAPTHSPGLDTTLHLRRINGCQMVSLLCLWESLRVLELDMTCEIFTCGEKEADSIIDLLVAMPLCKIEVIDVIIQPEVIVPEDAWLGSLKAFQPDPQQWVPRPLSF